MAAFLARHQDVVRAAVGSEPDAELRWQPVLGDVWPDVCVGQRWSTTGRCTWHVIVLGSPAGPLFQPSLELSTGLRDTVSGLGSARRWVAANLPGLHIRELPLRRPQGRRRSVGEGYAQAGN